jgi:DNA-binding transcriptional MerR regulator
MTSDGIQKQFTRQELAEALGLSEEKIDVFEGMGLISERSGSEGAKSYNSFDHARLRLIARCETAGYALDEIREMLPISPNNCRPASPMPKKKSSRSNNGSTKAVFWKPSICAAIRTCCKAISMTSSRSDWI